MLSNSVRTTSATCQSFTIATEQRTVTMQYEPPIIGQFLLIQNLGSNVRMSLCEVRAFAGKFDCFGIDKMTCTH